MLKKLSPIFIALLFAATGCEQKLACLTLNQDGSGTIRLRYSFDETAGENPDNPPERSSPEELTQESKEIVEDMATRMGDVAFVSGKPITDKQGWPGYEGLFSFEDINTVRITLHEDDDTSRVSGIEVPLAPTYSFKYTPGGSLEVTAEIEEAKKPFDPAKLDDDDWATNKAVLKGARETVLVKLPGSIKESNADFVVGNNKDTILLFDFKLNQVDDKSTLDIIEAMRRGTGPNDSLKMPGVQMQNAGDKVTVSFHAGAGRPEQVSQKQGKDDASLGIKNGGLSENSHSGSTVNHSKLTKRNRIVYGIAEDGSRNQPFSGTATKHFDDGKLFEKVTYKNGRKHGPYESYHENGQLAEKVTYKDGKKNGPFEFNNENGFSAKGSYQNGMRDGPYESYYANGQLMGKGTYKDGMDDGPVEVYHFNGQLKEKVIYKDGKKDGPYEECWENGKLKQKGTYKEGKKDGPYQIYYPNGKLVETGHYKDGKKVKDKK